MASYQKLGLLSLWTMAGHDWNKPHQLSFPGLNIKGGWCSRREVFCSSYSFGLEGSRKWKMNRTVFLTWHVFWEPLGNLGGVGRKQVSGLSQGILVTQIKFQDKKILDKFVHGNNCQTGHSLLMLEVLEFWSAFSQRICFSKSKKYHGEVSWILEMWFPYSRVTTVKKKRGRVGGRQGNTENKGMIEININPKGNLCPELCLPLKCWELLWSLCIKRDWEELQRKQTLRPKGAWGCVKATVRLKSWVLRGCASLWNSSRILLEIRSEIPLGPRPLIHQIPETQTGSPNGNNSGPL